MRPIGLVMLALLLAASAASSSRAQGPGTTRGAMLDATPGNLALTWSGASVTMPAAEAGAAPWQGRLADLPAQTGPARPVVILMHGSSGVAPFVKDYQTWLAGALGLASIAPDSFAVPDRMDYTSPLPVALYERVHALRSAELANALGQVKSLPWVDPTRLAVIGSSEGAVPVGRLGAAPGVVARVILSWSCEASYFVDGPRTGVPKDGPVLSIIASRDPFFSPLNPWNAGYATTGSCASALRFHSQATSIVLATDQHTIMNLPAARQAVAEFLRGAGVTPRIAP